MMVCTDGRMLKAIREALGGKNVKYTLSMTPGKNNIINVEALDGTGYVTLKRKGSAASTGNAGDQNCQVVMQLEKVTLSSVRHGKVQKTPICLKRLVLHNPKTGTYCVMLYNGENLRLVSWHNAGDDYGNRKWPLK